MKSERGVPIMNPEEKGSVGRMFPEGSSFGRRLLLRARRTDDAVECDRVFYCFVACKLVQTLSSSYLLKGMNFNHNTTARRREQCRQ